MPPADPAPATADLRDEAADAPVADAPIALARPDEGILVLTLSRPDRFNTLSVALMTALEAQLAAAAADPAVRVVVLGGAGKAFSAGHDLEELRRDPSRAAVTAVFAQCARLMLAITRLPKPVIARVHGIATAAGCQLVATCDLAVAADTARFAVSGINLGLFCATPMVAITRGMPRKEAMRLLLTGEFIDASTAREHGLVNEVVPAAALDDAVLALARRIARQSPAAVAFGKQLFHRQIEADLETAYRLAALTMVENLMGEDAQAGIDSFLAKRPLPAWTGR
jgi:enoyl-CoA hydratase/carnithine racemase